MGQVSALFGSLVIGMARNPHLEATPFRYPVVGFALSEAMGPFSPMVAFAPLGPSSALGLASSQEPLPLPTLGLLAVASAGTVFRLFRQL